jgi:hypothetical protein
MDYMVAYKLFRIKKDGNITSLFINKSKNLPIDEWVDAESYPTKGFKVRPFWHCTESPNAPHLSLNGRAWFIVNMEEYTEFIRPENQGNKWFLAKRIKIIKQL